VGGVELLWPFTAQVIFHSIPMSALPSLIWDPLELHERGWQVHPLETSVFILGCGFLCSPFLISSEKNCYFPLNFSEVEGEGEAS
jgi:hypothetical protein